ncbi:MAG: ORF6N domain-containing protein [Treponema sp.]|nr:ORF6N domain-containing protein [Treponema sp.]
MTDTIESRIFTIRGQKVMVDRDLAELYGVELKKMNQAAKRNIERFPADWKAGSIPATCSG